MSEGTSILIVYGYHPRETFAAKVGRDFARNLSDYSVRVVKYAGRKDNARSTRNLRIFLEKFDSSVIPIVLHNDGKTDVEAIIIYYARLNREKERARRLLFGFIAEYNKKNISVIFDAVLNPNAKRSLIEIEFNSKTDFERAKRLVADFSEYLLSH